MSAQPAHLVVTCLAAIMAQQAPGDPAGRSAKPVVGAVPASDCFGDPLPVGARARLGTVRFRVGVPITSATLSADGKVVVAGTGSQTVVLWDTASGKELQRVQTDGAVAMALALTLDGKKLATLSARNRIEIWDPAQDRLLARFQVEGRFFPDPRLTFSADGRVLAVGTQGFRNNKCAVYAWEMATGKQLGPMEPLHN